MAEEIIIKIQNSSGNKKNKEKKENKKEDGTIDLKSFLHPIKTAENDFKEDYPLSFYLYREVKRSVSQVARTAYNRYTTLSEDYKVGDRYSVITNNVGKAVSLGESAYMGAMIGSVAGPAGTLVGAVIGVGSTLISHTISHYDKLSDYYSQLNMNDHRTEFGRVRAGLIDGGRGTEN